MTTSIVGRLVVTDLYFMRWTVASCVVAGGAATLMMPLSPVAAYVGGVTLVCVLVILNIVLVTGGIVQDRKDKVQLFMLSLPVSTTQHTAAKVLANAVAFGGTWSVLTLLAVAVIHWSALPNGSLPFLLAVLVYLLFYYAVLLAVGVASDSPGWHATVITIGNISINFLVPLLLSLPSVAAHRAGPAAVWTRDIVGLIVLELAAAAVALGAGLYVRSRRTDFA